MIHKRRGKYNRQYILRSAFIKRFIINYLSILEVLPVCLGSFMIWQSCLVVVVFAFLSEHALVIVGKTGILENSALRTYFSKPVEGWTILGNLQVCRLLVSFSVFICDFSGAEADLRCSDFVLFSWKKN